MEAKEQQQRHMSYTQVDYSAWLKLFGSLLQLRPRNNLLRMTPETGTGYARSVTLEDGLSACINNYSLLDDYTFKRLGNSRFAVIIYLYDLQLSGSDSTLTDDIELHFEEGHHYTLYMVNAQSLHQFSYGKNAHLRGLSIYLDENWIRKNLHAPVMRVFDYLRQSNYLRLFMNAKQQRLINEVIDLPADHPYPEMFIRSRLYRIVDKILESFLQRDISENPERISEEDFLTLQKVESMLTNAFEDSFPGIEKLSRISLMSESKLKKLFKQSFGMGLYEYFQKNRMHQAKEQILTGKFSISEVGMRLGYQNLSNFSAAFRKEFNCLPSELAVR